MGGARTQLCESEGVEATVIGRFVPTGRLRLSYDGHGVADLTWSSCTTAGRRWCGRPCLRASRSRTRLELASAVGLCTARHCCAILGSLERRQQGMVIRQYDHEVQGGSVVKPLVGVERDGPSDAAVLRPVLARGAAWSSPAA